MNMDEYHEKIKEGLFFYCTATDKEVEKRLNDERNTTPLCRLPSIKPNREDKIKSYKIDLDMILKAKNIGVQLSLF